MGNAKKFFMLIIALIMAEGTVSYVDFRCLDHHNDYSYLPSACVTALAFYGSLGEDGPARLGLFGLQ